MRSQSTPKANVNTASQETWRTAIRVSDVKGRDKPGYGNQFRSPEDQLKQGRRFAESHQGVHDDAASLQNADLGVSGFSKRSTERPGPMRHLEDARAGKFQHLIFAYIDYSYRNIADGILLYEESNAIDAMIWITDAFPPRVDAVTRLLEVARMVCDDEITEEKPFQGSMASCAATGYLLTERLNFGTPGCESSLTG